MSDQEWNRHKINAEKLKVYERQVENERQRDKDKYPDYWRVLKEEETSQLKDKMNHQRKFMDLQKPNKALDEEEQEQLNQKEEEFWKKCQDFDWSQQEFEKERQETAQMLEDMHLMTKFFARDLNDPDWN